MDIRLCRALIVVSLMLSGCATRQTELAKSSAFQVAESEAFLAALEDYRAVYGDGGLSLLPQIAMLRAVYTLPMTIDSVRTFGAGALPYLNTITNNGDLDDRHLLASVCVQLIQAQETERSNPRVDPKTGIMIADYFVVPNRNGSRADSSP